MCVFIWNFSLTGLTFDSVDSAKRAKDALSGADIYSGCCTLKIDFAKVSTPHYSTFNFFFFLFFTWTTTKKRLLFVSRIKNEKKEPKSNLMSCRSLTRSLAAYSCARVWSTKANRVFRSRRGLNALHGRERFTEYQRHFTPPHITLHPNHLL